MNEFFLHGNLFCEYTREIEALCKLRRKTFTPFTNFSRCCAKILDDPNLRTNDGQNLRYTSHALHRDRTLKELGSSAKTRGLGKIYIP